MSDDHEPITEEWWCEYFGPATSELTQMVFFENGFALRFGRLSGIVSLARGNSVLCLNNVKTRGDVRELCRLVGWEKPAVTLPTTEGVK